MEIKKSNNFLTAVELIYTKKNIRGQAFTIAIAHIAQFKNNFSNSWIVYRYNNKLKIKLISTY